MYFFIGMFLLVFTLTELPCNLLGRTLLGDVAALAAAAELGGNVPAEWLRRRYPQEALKDSQLSILRCRLCQGRGQLNWPSPGEEERPEALKL